METLTSTDMIDVIVSDGHKGYDEQIPIHVAEKESLLREWLRVWSSDYSYITDNPDKRTATIRLQIISTESRDVLYVEEFEVTTTQT